MSLTLLEPIIVTTIIDAPISKVWDFYTNPLHIIGWNFASDDWRCIWAKTDLRVGGNFNSRMEAKDGSEGFEFGGVYTKITPQTHIAYTMAAETNKALFDGRKVAIDFVAIDDKQTKIIISFEPETQNTRELQTGGWQSIMDNFKHYTETTSSTKIIIHSPIETVWNHLTTSEGLSKYMQGMKVVSDWKIGSTVVYTCYTDIGAVMMWNGKQMIWNGIIKKISPYDYVVEYSGNAGLQQEQYLLEPISDSVTSVQFVQTAVDSQTSNNYQEGNIETLNMLKQYLEKKV